MMRNFSQGYKTYEEYEELISLKIEDLLIRRKFVYQHNIFDEIVFQKCQILFFNIKDWKK